ncbi:membrane protein [Pseudonocardia sp. EC080610-09]|uniref:hypothetical protein n=1 Tax=unclassified Pseudonocardia TaxID=2619320 RepID=UPI0006CB43B5|nr:MULTISPECIES: hypothetical protein [unclassified Pseudonocardia]ALE73492.1 membrane protein [Pseudonocardia sp. EC080625-04]ALL76986.1 membrane protein [Pseudonocardia sp. EC080610-09]ALL84017.1 membrane protein [Pseudonocardia sp. EC080619-01]
MAVAAAATWVWLGMVLAISFLEAPLKFRAPGITTALGVGIGRLVFRALNVAELVLLAVVAVALVVAGTPVPASLLAAAAAVVLAVQLLVVRPALTRRSNVLLRAGSAAPGPRSPAHLGYVALELVKVGVLVALGVAALS